MLEQRQNGRVLLTITNFSAILLRVSVVPACFRQSVRHLIFSDGNLGWKRIHSLMFIQTNGLCTCGQANPAPSFSSSRLIHHPSHTMPLCLAMTLYHYYNQFTFYSSILLYYYYYYFYYCQHVSTGVSVPFNLAIRLPYLLSHPPCGVR